MTDPLSDLENLKRPILQRECKKRGLQATGTNAALRKRLTEALSTKQELNDIETMNYRQLQEMCKKIGINARQKTHVLRNALLKHYREESTHEESPFFTTRIHMSKRPILRTEIIEQLNQQRLEMLQNNQKIIKQLEKDVNDRYDLKFRLAEIAKFNLVRCMDASQEQKSNYMQEFDQTIGRSFVDPLDWETGMLLAHEKFWEHSTSKFQRLMKDMAHRTNSSSEIVACSFGLNHVHRHESPIFAMHSHLSPETLTDNLVNMVNLLRDRNAHDVPAGNLIFRKAPIPIHKDSHLCWQYLPEYQSLYPMVFNDIGRDGLFI